MQYLPLKSVAACSTQQKRNQKIITLLLKKKARFPNYAQKWKLDFNLSNDDLKKGFLQPILSLLNLVSKPFNLKGHSQLWDCTDLDTTFASLKNVYLNPKSNLCVGCIQKSPSILPSVSFNPRSFTENLFLSKLLLIL